MPKGTSASDASYWWPESSGRGLIGNDTFAVLKDAPHPVLAHRFLFHMLDLEEAFVNFEYICYQQPLTGMTPEQIVEEEAVPPS